VAGGACIYMRGILEAYGDRCRRVFVADSFRGLPPPNPEIYPADGGVILHTYEQLAVSRREVEENFRKYGLFDERVVFLEGWFKDTLPKAPIERLSVLRLDGDLYESTIQVLEACYHKVSRGGYVIIDDYALPPCAQAVDDFRSQHGVISPLVPIDWTGVWWLVDHEPLSDRPAAGYRRRRQSRVRSSSGPHDHKQKSRRAGGITRTVNAGLAHHQAGRLARAELLYRVALHRDPNHAEALHLLGLIAYQAGKIGPAIALIERALPQLPHLPEAHLNLDNALREAGMLTEAVVRYRHAIALDPDYGMAHSNLARALSDTGQFEAAFQSSTRAVALMPEFAGAHVNFAAALIGLGRFAEAEAPLRRALDLMPDHAEIHRDLGRVLTELGRLDEAVASCQRAVALVPDDFEAHFYLGAALRAQNRLEDAVASYRQAMLRPGSAEGHTRLGNLLKALGKADEAVASHQQALALVPDNPMVLNNLGCALQAQNRLDEAVANYRRALALKPDFADAHNNLGTALQAQYRLDDAAASYQRALALKPDFAEAHNNLGVLLTDLGTLDEAIASCQKALLCVPNNAAIHNNLGNALLARNRLDDAIASYRRALALDPAYAQAHCNLGEALEIQGRPSEAVASLGRALALKPDHAVALATWFHTKQRVCDWSGYRVDEARVRNAVAAEPPLGGPFILLSLWSTPEEQFDCARRVAEAFTVPESAVLPRPRPGPRDRIRLGYLSADFRHHATAFLIAGLIEHHDRRGFEVIGYSCGSDDESAIRARLAAGFDRFVDLSKISHRQAAEQIHADAVDILIDLKGFTRYCRTAILAHRPAPIQVNYLGYPGTMGADFIDYIIVDPFVVPLDQQSFYSEKLVHLADCYQCNDDKRVISEQTPSRVQCGLPKHGFIFCCFNNTYKITPIFFDIWMRLLCAVPGSVLWLLGMNASAKGNLAREAAARGVDPERLVFAPPLPVAKHLARHRLADLFLDTLPVNAHTTASDALWAGLPLLTCAGNTFAGRVSGSLLRAIGLGELVTTSLEEYEALALRLAQEPEALARLRARLAQNRLTHPLFDTERYARHLEAAYRRMWEIGRAGQPPAAFSVSSSAGVSSLVCPEHLSGAEPSGR
jgi:protein O-GlcNAc transferase